MNINDFKTAGIIYKTAVQMQENELDCLFLVGGVEGSGKSDWILKSVEYIDYISEKETPVENICLSVPKFINRLKIPPKSTLVLDEGNDLASFNHNSPLVKSMVKIFKVMRKKRFITFIAFTNPAKMQQYFKGDRMRGAFIVKKRINYEYSLIYYYSRKRWEEVLSILEKKKTITIQNILTYSPTLKIESQGRYEGNLRKIYDQEKDDNIESEIDDIIEKYGHKKSEVYGCYSMDQVASILKVCRNTITARLSKEYLEEKKNVVGQFVFNNDDVKYIKEILSTTQKRGKTNPHLYKQMKRNKELGILQTPSKLEKEISVKI